MLLNEVKETISEYLISEFDIENPDFDVLPAAKPEDGDFYTNAALKHQKITSKGPLYLAEVLANLFAKNENFSTKIAKPGFVNFYLNNQFLEDSLSSAHKVEMTNVGKNAVIEYVSPNTNKPLHIGHIRNSALAISLINILSKSGYLVKKAIVYNNRGLHITKSMWGYLLLGCTKAGVTASSDWKNIIKIWSAGGKDWLTPSIMAEGRLNKPDHFIGHFYVLANEFVDKNKKVEEDWQQMLLAWENKNDPMHDLVRELWSFVNNYFYTGYEESAKDFEFRFDARYISYESNIYGSGKETILEGVKKGLFEKVKGGAIEADLSDFSLPNKILVRSDGTGIYMTFDVELTRQRTQLKSDLLIWVVGSDQNLYFKQLFAVSQLLGLGSGSKFIHYSYGMVRVPGGKMSSRDGTVVYADDMLTLVKSEIKNIMEKSSIGKESGLEDIENTVHDIALGALKWSMISNEPVKDIAFDLAKTVSFTGFSGPYVQYTHARCFSVLDKARFKLNKNKDISLDSEDIIIARTLFGFTEQVNMATKELAPHYICHYLFDLCQTFNSYYANTKIIGSKNEYSKLVLTSATKEVIKTGLSLLGISAPEKM